MKQDRSTAKTPSSSANDASRSGLALRMRRARTHKGLTQARLAQRLGIQRASVTQWEHPQGTMPTLQNLMRVAVETAVALEWLACGRGPMQLETSQDASAFSIECVAQDAHEEALLAAYRIANHRQRNAIIELACALGGIPRATRGAARRTSRGDASASVEAAGA